jgi:hypothetical protein
MPITTTPSGGAQGEYSTYTPIYAQTLSSSASSITFSNIPGTYTDLVLVSNLTGSTVIDPSIQFNGDTGANYSNTNLSGNGSSAFSNRNTSVAYVRMDESAYGSTANPTSYVTQINNYANTTTYKTILGRNNNGATGVDAIASSWRGSTGSSTQPITAITVYCRGSGNFVSGSTFTLYGIKAAAPAPKASGGDGVYTDGTYWYHVFNSSGILDVRQDLTCDYLVVAGGAGAGYLSGGGGAGGYRHFTSQSLTTKQYPVVIGAGGAKASVTRTSGANGSNTTFNSISATGGGHGSFEDGNANAGLAASAGGSGGGAPVAEPSNAYGAGNAGGYSPVEGYRGGGGTGDRAYNNGAGGGGGSSAVGGNGTTSSGGAGGAGTLNSISGVAVYYATGGGGAFNFNGASGSGLANLQSGSGGSSSSGTTAGTGNPNTGNGAGGRYNGGTASDSASGGSGVVIVRYAV